MASEPNGATERPSDIPREGLVFYVVKASPTSTVNCVKVLMLIEELSIPHSVYVVGSPGKEAWFRSVNPCKMVPALEDTVDGADGKLVRANVFESTSCLTFLADKYDEEHVFSGRNLDERAVVGNWMTVHTAGLGATSKFWLWFKILYANEIGTTLQRLAGGIREQYTLLDKRLSEPGQEYIALADRPTIADFVNLPFANERIASTAGFDFNDWPRLKSWSEKMLARPAVQRAHARIVTFGV